MITVKDLIDSLLTLPSNTEVWLAWFGGEEPVEYLSDIRFMVYRHNNITRLFMNDGEASHPDIEPYWIPLDAITKKES